MFQLYLAEYACTFYTYDSSTFYVTLYETTASYNVTTPVSGGNDTVPITLDILYALAAKYPAPRTSWPNGTVCAQLDNLLLTITTCPYEILPVQRRIEFDTVSGANVSSVANMLSSMEVTDRPPPPRTATITPARLFTLLGAVPLLRNLEICFTLRPEMANNNGPFVHSVIWDNFILQFAPLSCATSGIAELCMHVCFVDCNALIRPTDWFIISTIFAAVGLSKPMHLDTLTSLQSTTTTS
jgi:hypothetical protein